MAKADDNHLAALNACVVHARHLLESAKAVQAIHHNNIAYHLAALALEELGKRELYRIQESARAVGDPPIWQISHSRSRKETLLVSLQSRWNTGHDRPAAIL